MRILIVEDDEIVADALKRGLINAQFIVDRVVDAESAQSLLTTVQFDLAVIDIGLPGADGFALVRRLRTLGNTIPILILTARHAQNDKVRAFDLGADDYLSKPYELTELIARCRALIRRATAATSGVIVFGRLAMDMARQQLRIDDHLVDLTLSEWIVLECLIRQTGHVTAKERLIQAIGNLDRDVTPNAVEVHVSRLRSKLGTAAVICALRGMGYRLQEP